VTRTRSPVLHLVSAALAAAALSVPVIAAEKINLRLGGFFNAAAVGISQNENHGLRAESFVSSGEIYVQGWTDLDDGWSAGVRAEFELERDNGYTDTFSKNAQYQDDLVDEIWAYVEGPYGRIEFGQQDGVADQMMFYGPSVSQAIRVNNPDIFLLECPDGSFCPGAPIGRPYTPNEMQLRTDMHVSEDYSKIIYYTPRLHGFQVGVSYTPELVRNFSGFATRQSNQTNQQSHIWEFGVNYAERFGSVDVGLSAAYLTGENENPQTHFASGEPGDDVEEIGFGALINWREWTLGGSFRRTNVLGGANIRNDGNLAFNDFNVFRNLETELWDVGLKYESGPWSAGVNYVSADAELPFKFNQKGEAIEIAGGLLVGPGIQVAAGYQHFNFDGPNGTCNVAICDSAEAGVFYLETTLSF
jgi:outer membrane protein OmpU